MVRLSISILLAALLVGCGSDPEPQAPADEVTAPAPTSTGNPSPPPAPTSEIPRPPPLDLGDTITVPEGDDEKWSWVPIEGSKCGDGTKAGIGVNFTKQSRELVIWFQGNGACYNSVTCLAFKGLLVGMGPDPIWQLFWGDLNTGRAGPFNRLDPKNPFKKANYVAFPHCAVDGHAANIVHDYPGVGTVTQQGYVNVTEALKRIVPTFKDASRITVMGFSAGGIGTVANYHQIASAFEEVGQKPPFMINDAGPVIRKPFLADNAQKSLREGWGLDATFLSFCPDCATDGIHRIHEAMWRAHPGMRSALISTYDDMVSKNLYRLLNFAPGIFNTFHEGLLDFEEWAASMQGSIGSSKHRSFFRPGNKHGLILPNFSDEPQLADFIQNQLDDSPNWRSDTP